MLYTTTASTHALMEQRRRDAATMPASRPRTRAGIIRLAALLAMTTLLITLGVGTVQAAGTDMTESEHQGSDQSPAEAHGIYLLDNGEQLTILGFHHWSTEYELEGYLVGLVPDGRDRFVARDNPAEVLTVTRDSAGEVTGVVLNRPGEPQQFGLRQDLFDEEVVSFDAGEVVLAGTLILPKGEGPHPAVVIVHGAEFATRDIYRLLGMHYARRGVAVLIYDKRGTGESTGSFSEATFEDLAGDALAAVSLLKDHPSIDSGQIGLVGFSQGAWIVAMAAQQSDDIAFLVAVSPSGLSPADSAAWLSGNLLSLRGLDERSIETARRGWGMMYSTLRLVDAGLMPSMPHLPGFWFHALDPHVDTSSLWSQIRQPVLGIWGELDCQVSARDSVAAFGEALRAGGNTQFTLQVMPGASHGMALVEPCAHELGGMHSHGGRYQYAPDYFSVPVEWIISGPGDTEVVIPEQPTPSPLGWHQTPSSDVPWYGTFLPQAAAFVLMIAAFGGVAAISVWRATFGRSRVADRGRSNPWLRGSVALAGLAATILGGVALAELLLLGNVHTGFLVGGPLVAGASPLLRVASALAWATVILTVALAFFTAGEWLSKRSKGVSVATPWLTVAMLPVVLLFIGCASYWGSLSLRLLTG